MTHTVLGELGTQPSHSAFSQGHEVRPRHAGSQPSVSHHVMKYKLAGREGEKGKEQKIQLGCSHSPLSCFDKAPQPHTWTSILFLKTVYCIVYMSCFIEAGEGGTGTSGILAAVLQCMLFEEGLTLFSVTSALVGDCQILAFFKPFLFPEKMYIFISIHC